MRFFHTYHRTIASPTSRAFEQISKISKSFIRTTSPCLRTHAAPHKNNVLLQSHIHIFVSRLRRPPPHRRLRPLALLSMGERVRRFEVSSERVLLLDLVDADDPVF